MGVGRFAGYDADSDGMVTPRFVRAAHELGIRVDVWTIDCEANRRRLLGYGVDGIMTDRPDVLAQLLK